MARVQEMTEAGIDAVSAIRVRGRQTAYTGYTTDGAIQSDTYGGTPLPETRYRRTLP
ncbi:hypothetical protein [Streptomyces cacaoi]|nr:hypothetical protein [Streptomyces cacaoi]NNG85044.1 hypothetical protein [Streptomyces cacaoi]